jgi:glyoxylase-like metal-dependent hydrolase (beta-lactamase superfamily II)
MDVTIGVVRASSGLLVVDTHSSHRLADMIIADLAELGRPVKWVVNTHAHFDHTFGNARFGLGSDIGAMIYGHERIPAHLDRYERPRLAGWIENGDGPVPEIGQVVITPPTVLVGKHFSIDLGDRLVELHHVGPGHTDTDLVIHVPDATTWFAGDILEQSGPPMYGSGSYPLDWPDEVAAFRALLEPDAVIIPGHGAPIDDSFAAAQERDFRTVADLVVELHAAGVPIDEAVQAGGDRWPFPPGGMQRAVEDGYQQLAKA